jgi:hypothetical protein
MKRHIFSSIAAAIAVTAISLYADPVVEINNKSKRAISVTISTVKGDKLNVLEQGTINADTAWESTKVVDLNTILWITVHDPLEPIRKFHIDAPGKTKYLTWSPDKSISLYPRTGPLMGLGKLIGMKSKSGYSLNNNLSAGQITLLRDIIG